MNFEVNRELVLSTSHIDDEAAKFLNDSELNYSSDPANYRLHVGTMLLPEIYIPEVIRYIAAIALAQDCKWLVLDCDGDVHVEIPQFDW